MTGERNIAPPDKEIFNTFMLDNMKRYPIPNHLTRIYEHTGNWS